MNSINLITSFMNSVICMNIKVMNNVIMLYSPYYKKGSIAILKEFTDEIIETLFNEVSNGLCLLDDLSLVHGRIKPDNVLIGDDNRFILSNYCENDLNGNEPGKYEDLYYISPELLQGKELSHKSDVFSLGVLLVYILFKSPVLCSNYDEKQCKYLKIVKKCCDSDPNKRPTIKEIRSFFSKKIKEDMDEDDVIDILLKDIPFVFELISNDFMLKDSIIYNKIITNKSIYII